MQTRLVLIGGKPSQYKSSSTELCHRFDMMDNVGKSYSWPCWCSNFSATGRRYMFVMPPFSHRSIHVFLHRINPAPVLPCSYSAPGNPRVSLRADIHAISMQHNSANWGKRAQVHFFVVLMQNVRRRYELVMHSMNYNEFIATAGDSIQHEIIAKHWPDHNGVSLESPI